VEGGSPRCCRLLFLTLSDPTGAAARLMSCRGGWRRREGEGLVADSAERCRKRPRPSIRTPAGNCRGGGRTHPEPRRDFSACWSMDAGGGGAADGKS